MSPVNGRSTSRTRRAWLCSMSATRAKRTVGYFAARCVAFSKTRTTSESRNVVSVMSDDYQGVVVEEGLELLGQHGRGGHVVFAADLDQPGLALDSAHPELIVSCHRPETLAVYPRGGKGSGVAIASDWRILPSSPWMRISPPPLGLGVIS